MGGNGAKFIEERKENRALLGQQVMNGMTSQNANQALAKARHASAKKRPPQGLGSAQFAQQ